MIQYRIETLIAYINGILSQEEAQEISEYLSKNKEAQAFLLDLIKVNARQNFPNEIIWMNIKGKQHIFYSGSVKHLDTTNIDFRSSEALICNNFQICDINLSIIKKDSNHYLLIIKVPDIVEEITLEHKDGIIYNGSIEKEKVFPLESGHYILRYNNTDTTLTLPEIPIK